MKRTAPQQNSWGLALLAGDVFAAHPAEPSPYAPGSHHFGSHSLYSRKRHSTWGASHSLVVDYFLRVA